MREKLQVLFHLRKKIKTASSQKIIIHSQRLIVQLFALKRDPGHQNKCNTNAKNRSQLEEDLIATALHSCPNWVLTVHS